MIRHIVMWKLKEEVDQAVVAEAMKQGLEQLNGKIAGLLDLEVGIGQDPGDVVLVSSHSSWDALKEYAAHPLHQAAAKDLVVPYAASRQAVDYEVE